MHRACDSKDQTLKKTRTLHFPKRKTQEGAKEKGAKGANERKRVAPRKNCQQPDLKQSGWGTESMSA